MLAYENRTPYVTLTKLYTTNVSRTEIANLKPQSPQATVCCKVGAAALVHLRPGGPGLPNRGFKCSRTLSILQYS